MSQAIFFTPKWIAICNFTPFIPAPFYPRLIPLAKRPSNPLSSTDRSGPAHDVPSRAHTQGITYTRGWNGGLGIITGLEN